MNVDFLVLAYGGGDRGTTEDQLFHRSHRGIEVAEKEAALERLRAAGLIDRLPGDRYWRTAAGHRVAAAITKARAWDGGDAVLASYMYGHRHR